MFRPFFRHLCFTGVVELSWKGEDIISFVQLTYHLLKYALIYLAHSDNKIKCRTKQEKTSICTFQENGENCLFVVIFCNSGEASSIFCMQPFLKKQFFVEHFCYVWNLFKLKLIETRMLGYKPAIPE